jgi:flagellar hook assembly protein FlgD
VPNPFNPRTAIHFDVPAGGGVVTIRIYDVTGRLVRTLVDGPQTAGQKTATWDGKDNRGGSVTSGVYFYRLQAPDYSKTLKMVLLR